MRGNVNTRLAKLDAGEYDAIILACAGLIRLDMADRIRAELSAVDSLPAVGQGAVGIECRNDNAPLIALLQCLTCPETTVRVMAERAMNAKLQGGCQVPIGSYATLTPDASGNIILHLSGLVANVDGTQLLESDANVILEQDAATQVQQAISLGQQIAQQLLDQGAGEILAAVELGQ